MPVIDSVLTRLPPRFRAVALRHRELVKFGTVGAIAYVVDTVLFTVTKSTVLEPKPVTAKIFAVLVATIVSYVLTREWAFRTRGGRERHHEAALFFLVCGIGLCINAVPLWISRYVLELATPAVSLLTQEVADFVSANVVGTLLAMAFRWWGFRRFVFPDDADPPDDRPGTGRLGGVADSAGDGAGRYRTAPEAGRGDSATSSARGIRR